MIRTIEHTQYGSPQLYFNKVFGNWGYKFQQWGREEKQRRETDDTVITKTDSPSRNTASYTASR
jgi:hypothetical protein